MAYYRICPECGAALDPGERCDCRIYLPRNEASTSARYSTLYTGREFVRLRA